MHGTLGTSKAVALALAASLWAGVAGSQPATPSGSASRPRLDGAPFPGRPMTHEPSDAQAIAAWYERGAPPADAQEACATALRMMAEVVAWAEAHPEPATRAP